ncbi:transcriptional regulator Xre [Acetobacter pasteurianus NBRC 3279]|nr:transcriptional regulator Xre [Acetobacter pasteurianus NBRC 3279]GCD71617.1 transcriptional regulator Xre [Acetobacter pasteurianus NBRC 3284]
MAIVNGTKISVSAAQVKAARALIGLSQDDLAALSGIPKRTIVRFELEEGTPRKSTVEAIKTTLENKGVRFISKGCGGPGIASLQKHAHSRRIPEKNARIFWANVEGRLVWVEIIDISLQKEAKPPPFADNMIIHSAGAGDNGWLDGCAKMTKPLEIFGHVFFQEKENCSKVRDFITQFTRVEEWFWARDILSGMMSCDNIDTLDLEELRS